MTVSGQIGGLAPALQSKALLKYRISGSSTVTLRGKLTIPDAYLQIDASKQCPAASAVTSISVQGTAQALAALGQRLAVSFDAAILAVEKTE